jgi:hypothetical protein
MKFIDEARIEVIAGQGGAGSASMRREVHRVSAVPMAVTAERAVASGLLPIAISIP